MVQYNHEESFCYGNSVYGASYDAPGSNSYMQDNWAHIAETTLPLRTSKLASVNRSSLQASIELRSKQLSFKVITVNLISLLANMLLAAAAFYFAFTKNSSLATAFGADCVLDFVSSAIILWRYHGDLNSVYMQAREQIACIYLGALFEISAFGIIIKGLGDIVSGPDLISNDQLSGSRELIYLAIVATIVCCITTVFKTSLYKTIRDSSILLDVINTLISTVFAMSIVMSQLLIDVNPSFWYLDPTLSILLALFMIGFGIKVIHENFNILKPVYYNQTNGASFNDASYLNESKNLIQIGTMKQNGKNSLIKPMAADTVISLPPTWQKSDYSTISFN